ncbi:MAG: thioredoxin family protein [Longimicrobiales bacterium]|nr:thioredoxin family protein [Longimicrobiales bacterium]
MARTPSTMPDLGLAAPDFALPDAVTGRTVRLADFREAPALLVVFWCNHCPFVKHIEDAFLDFARAYLPMGLEVVAISANDPERYPDDAPEAMRELANRKDYPFPYLFDHTQRVARAYRAACTPDFFLFDRDHRLFYRGQFDDARPSTDEPVTGRDLRRAVDAVLAGEAPPPQQTPSVGCNIKWRPGNEPDYFG